MLETPRQPAGGKVPVMECFTQAWRFLDRNWRLMLPAAGITAAISLIGMALVLVVRPADVAAESMLAPSMWNLLAMTPARIASLMFAATVLRKALRNEFVGRTGIAFGADELRLLGVMAALMCMIVPLVGLTLLVMSTFVFSRLAASPEELNALMADPDAFTLALEAALGPTGMLALSLLIVAGAVLALYLSARLTMVNAATVGERRMVIFQTWSWSRGNVWRILAAIILTALPVIFFQALLESLRIEILRATSASMVMVLAISGVTNFLLAIASIPTIALGAILYKGLRPADFVAK